MAARENPPGRRREAPSKGALEIDAAAFRGLLNAGLMWLERHHEIVNALNVFPVPDGDTGTNMLLTMRSACQETNGGNGGGVGDVARAAAHGALMGARGNSGVILSQILRGMARKLEGEQTLTGVRLAAALAEGSRIAYKGVNKPVEGTILTVVREAATAAESASALHDDLVFVMDHTVRAAGEAVANTPNLLPVLARAGKVDSGGKGLFYILEGMQRALLGTPADVEAVEAAPVAPVEAPRPQKGKRPVPAMEHGFDVQFLVEGPALDVAAIKERISSMGQYPLVEGDSNLVKVHVHVPDPGVVLSYAVSLGFITDVVVENMDDMGIPDMPAGYDPTPPRFAAEPDAVQPEPAEDFGGPAVVAVAPGAGLAQVFRSLGAQEVVTGGQTMNPSTQELLEAINRAPGDEVIVLPNNGNVIMTAQQAQSLSSKTVRVVGCKTIPQGISALLALNPHVSLDRNLQGMANAAEFVSTGEVTIAVQDAEFDGIRVKAGDIIGLLNEQLTARGSEPNAVVRDLLEQMHASELEILTLYYGQPVTRTQAEQLSEELRELYPNQDLELVDGGQPFYHYIIAGE